MAFNSVGLDGFTVLDSARIVTEAFWADTNQEDHKKSLISAVADTAQSPVYIVWYRNIVRPRRNTNTVDKVDIEEGNAHGSLISPDRSSHRGTKPNPLACKS